VAEPVIQKISSAERAPRGSDETHRGGAEGGTAGGPHSASDEKHLDGAESRIRTGSWEEHEAQRRAALRRDAQRDMSVNLSEGIALSRFLAGFAGSAREQ